MAEKYKSKVEGLSIRSEPKLDDNIVGGLSKGDVVTLIEIHSDQYWYKIKHNNIEGWCSSKYLEKVVSGSDLESGDPAWLTIAFQEHGIKEISGSGNNPRILEYHRSTSLPDSMHKDSVAWCSSFTNWCVEQAGFAGTDKANARSWLYWGRNTNNPKRGDIVVFKKINSDWEGHVGFFLSQTNTTIEVLGGNQSNAVNKKNYKKNGSTLKFAEYRTY